MKKDKSPVSNLSQMTNPVKRGWAEVIPTLDSIYKQRQDETVQRLLEEFEEQSE